MLFYDSLREFFTLLGNIFTWLYAINMTQKMTRKERAAVSDRPEQKERRYCGVKGSPLRNELRHDISLADLGPFAGVMIEARAGDGPEAFQLVSLVDQL